MLVRRSAHDNRWGCLFDEYHVNDRISYPDNIRSLAPKEVSCRQARGNPRKRRRQCSAGWLFDEGFHFNTPAAQKGIRHELQGRDVGIDAATVNQVGKS